jgi:uncharacterized protein (DUF2062 family)
MLFKRREQPPVKDRLKEFVSPKRGHRRAFDYIVWRLKRRPGTPEYIAKGFAIGIAINYWPILFTHLIIGWVFCRILKGDLIAMFIGTLAGNPWTFAIVYPLTYRMGKTLLGLRPVHNPAAIDSAEEIWKQLWPVKSWDQIIIAFDNVLIPMMIGGFLLALPSAIFAYYVARNAVRLYHVQKQHRLRKKFDSVEAEIEKGNPHA